jgi:hypothetical protein
MSAVTVRGTTSDSRLLRTRLYLPARGFRSINRAARYAARIIEQCACGVIQNDHLYSRVDSAGTLERALQFCVIHSILVDDDRQSAKLSRRNVYRIGEQWKRHGDLLCYVGQRGETGICEIGFGLIDWHDEIEILYPPLAADRGWKNQSR